MAAELADAVQKPAVQGRQLPMLVYVLPPREYVPGGQGFVVPTD